MLSIFDGAANAGRFPEFFSKNEDKIERWLIDLKKTNRPALDYYFYHMVQSRFGRQDKSGKYEVWKPLKELTEQVMLRNDSIPAEQLHDNEAQETFNPVNKVIDALEANANKGRFPEAFSENEDTIRRMLITLKENEPAALNYFYHVVQDKLGQNAVWEPLKELTEQVMSRDDSAGSVSLSGLTLSDTVISQSDLPQRIESLSAPAGSDSGSATPTQREFPSVPTIAPEKAEDITKMLDEMHDAIQRTDCDLEFNVNMIRDLRNTRYDDPQGFEFLMTMLQERPRTRLHDQAESIATEPDNSALSWQEGTTTNILDGMKYTMDFPNNPTKDKEDIKDLMKTMKSAEAFEILENMLQDKPDSDASWKQLKDLVKELKF